MITITPGATSSIWVSLKEAMPAGVTATGVYTLQLVREITGDLFTYSVTDIASDNKWSKFNLNLSLQAGNYSYKFTENSTSTILEVGRAVVTEPVKVWPVRQDIPKKTNNVRVYKKN